jgi:hypothetical protein
MNAATYTVRYPSGAEFTVTGHLRKIAGPHGPLPAVDRGDDVVVLDPRAVILAAGAKVYGPRDLLPDDHSPEFRAWLAGHPAWDRP